jgi:hypothetical protein
MNLNWDSDNKLRSADIDANGMADVNFQYDALGGRVARSGTSGSVVYVQMDQQTIADYPVGGAGLASLSGKMDESECGEVPNQRPYRIRVRFGAYRVQSLKFGWRGSSTSGGLELINILEIHLLELPKYAH